MTSLQIANKKIKDLHAINSNLKAKYEVEKNELCNRITSLEKTIADSEKRFMDVLNAQAKIIQQINDELSSVKEENARLRKENDKLKDENIKLKDILSKDCNNSSTPPSQSKKPRINNLREPSKNKAGAQVGHKGKTITKEHIKTILQSDNVEHVIVNHGNPQAKKCVVKYEVDTKTIVTVTEHRFFFEHNEKCSLPRGFRTDVHYGPAIKALVNILAVQEVVSMERIEEFISILTQDVLNISQGSISNWIRECAIRLHDINKKSKKAIKNSGNMFLDTTESKVGKSKSYVRNFSTSTHTWYMPCKNKRKIYLEKSWIAKNYTGMVTHDHDTAMYSVLPFATHVECNVHTRRYLKNILELSNHTWPTLMDCLLLEIKEQKEIAIQNGFKSFSDEAIQAYISRYREILDIGYSEVSRQNSMYIKEKELQLLNRLKKYEENHLMFMTNFKAQFDNNLSERDLRPVKTKKKISGGNRNYKWLRYYCEIRSVISTCKKQAVNFFKVIMSPKEGINLINFT